VLFESKRSEKAVKQILEARLLELAGKPVEVMVRTAAEMADVLARNPFPDAPGNRTVAIFLDAPPPQSALENITGRVDEEVRLGHREIYVRYGADMGHSKLKIPAGKHGTARNMNTVAKLAELAKLASKLAKCRKEVPRMDYVPSRSYYWTASPDEAQSPPPASPRPNNSRRAPGPLTGSAH
jgi:uncharacterized protein (DUF1697 family)